MHLKRDTAVRLVWITSAAGVILVVACWIYVLRTPHSNVAPSIMSVRKNIQYCNTSNPSQTFDLYRPNGTENSQVPLVVYIHGGGWRSGSKDNALIANYTNLFVAHGLAVASIGYRLNTPNPYPDQNDDVACALAYIENHTASLNVETNNMIFFGDSAGGQLAAFAALNIPYKKYDYEAPRGVIDFYGITDFSKIVLGSRPDLNARRYLGSSYNQHVVAASPSTYVTKNAPRFLFIHGTKDTIVPIAQSQELYHSLVGTGIDAEYVAISGARHGFIGPELSRENYQIVLNAMTLFMQETINR